MADFAHEKIQKFRSFIPPMPEQLGVIRCDDDWRPVQNGFQLLNLRDALTQKMPCVFAGGRQGMVALVNLLLAFAGDAKIFYAGKTAVVRRRQVRLDVIEIQIEADVAVEIAVARIAGIALVLAPDLPRGIEVAPKRGDAVRRVDRRKGAVTRPPQWSAMASMRCSRRKWISPWSEKRQPASKR